MNTNRVIKNATWIIGCRIIQSILGLLIGMFTARYLGPSNYGILNYATAIVAFVTPIMQLGFRNTLVREIVDKPEAEGETVGTAVTLNVISSVCCVVVIGIFVGIVNYGETDTIIVCLLYSLSLVVQAFEMIQYWYQAKLLSKYTAVVSVVAYLIVSLYKVYLLVSGRNIYWFALSQALDYLIISVLLFIIYRKIGGQRLSFSLKTGKTMLSISRYYIISSIMVAAFNHIGSIILKLFMDETAVGYYSAAVTCVNITGFIFNSVIDSMRPSILEAKKTNEQVYKSRIIGLYSVVTFGTIVQSIVISLFSHLIINILYGQAYISSVAPLRIMSLMAVFSYLGVIRNIWILAEGKQKYLWIINLCGAIFNIVLNIVLVSIMGVFGAAITSVVTQIFTNVLLGFLIPPIRENNKLMLKGLNPKYFLFILKEYIRTK